MSIEKNFLFVHAPKTGGTSIKNVLKEYQAPDGPGYHHALFLKELHDRDMSWQDLSEYYDEQLDLGNEKVIKTLQSLPNPIKDRDEFAVYNNVLKSCLTSDFHLSIDQWKQIIHPKLFERLTKFGVVRNPYDRVISLHLWQNNGIFDKKVLLKKIEEFAYLLYNGWNPQSYYYCNVVKSSKEDLIQETMPTALKHVKSPDFFVDLKPGIDFYLKYETQLNQATIDSLCKSLKIDGSQLYHLNKNSKKKKDCHYSLYYDDEIYDVVTSVYDSDIKMFGYEFEDKR